MRIEKVGAVDNTEKDVSVKNMETGSPIEADRKKLKTSCEINKPFIRGISKKYHGNYRMNSIATIYEMGKRMDGQSQAFYTKALYSGDNSKVKLIGKEAEFYVTGVKASGNFLTKQHPGKSASERREKLQLPPENNGEVISKVKSTRAQIVIESDIVAQPAWAKKSGYRAKTGMKQIYTPNLNPRGAICDNRYEKIDK